MTTPKPILEARAALRRHSLALLTSEEPADRELAAALIDLLTARKAAPGLFVAIVGAVVRPALTPKGRRRFFDALGEEFRRKNELRALRTARKAA